MPKEIYLFTDGSVNPKSKIGFGASLLVEDLNIAIEEAKKLVQLKQFKGTSLTKLELQILVWSLEKLDASNKQVIVYTDSQNIIGLPNRRSRFEKNGYISNNGRLIDNHELYKEFYRICDKLQCSFEKLKRHKRSQEKDKVDRLFTIVDRDARNELRTIGA